MTLAACIIFGALAGLALGLVTLRLITGMWWPT
jgi:hypothetical protein